MYMLFAGNNTDDLSFSSICRYKSYDSDDVECRVTEKLKDMDFCFIINGEEGILYHDYKVVDWNNRQNAKTAQEAAKVVANRLSELDIRNPNPDQLREIEEYATSKGVPFSASVHTQFLANFNSENPMWDSSSAYC